MLLLQVGVDCFATWGPSFVFGQEVEQSIEPRVERRQRPGDLVAHGHHCHGVAGHTFGHLQEEEDGPRHMERKEAQGKEQGDGDDGLYRFASAVGVRGMRAKENRHPFFVPGGSRPSDPVASSSVIAVGLIDVFSVFWVFTGRRLGMQCSKNGQDDMGVTPSNDCERYEEAQHV